eukprot:scaffold524_cov357-Pavlova_lutheri.AAC.32
MKSPFNNNGLLDQATEASWGSRMGASLPCIWHEASIRKDWCVPLRPRAPGKTAAAPDSQGYGIVKHSVKYD